MDRPFYITTPIYYVNDVPHIGHAYTTIAADVLARYHRLRGRQVFFLTGVDEHGQKVQQAAAKAGIDPQAYCDKLAPQFERLWQRLNISNDAFIRTTDKQHQEIVQRYLRELFERKLIYSDQYTGWYCTFDERFWTEKDVVDGLCPDCKRPVEQLSERNYFFKMGQYQDRLITHIKQHPDFILPTSRRNEVLGFLESQKLGDLSISRPKSRLSWGIELPFDPDYVTYVWFDALVNYVSALEYLPEEKPAGNHFWPADVHLVGKDILTTHAVYWSTILMALGLDLPKTIFAHGWWTVDGEKMSKSRGNVVDPNVMIERFGTDAFRYFLLREVPFGQDGDFSEAAMVGRINSDLANGLGNLLSRTLTLIERFSEGQVPECRFPDDQFTEDLNLAGHDAHAYSDNHFSSLEFNRVLELIWKIVQACDQYIEKTAPWVLAKDQNKKVQLNRVLYRAADTLRLLCIHIYPFMPQTAEEMARQLGLSISFEDKFKKTPVTELFWNRFPANTKVNKGNPLFPRIEPNKLTGAKPVTDSSTPAAATTQPTTPAATPVAAPVAPAAPAQITIEEFQKIQLKTAKVLTAERVPRSEKLIKLQVDLGAEQRQIVAGIGKKYEPEQLVGRTIVIVANLKPAKLMGIESQGMVLAAGDAEVKGLVGIAEDVDPGTKVK
ncbi:Methionine--tRNA ligase [Nitrospira tepida]|uniref:Methionine--tRNA ligase n=1 Tax=Nitrospira tepida TaxID=2973512 RepID=A0AA86T6M0_9BACT|nr:methionine--tRNA ligase [Nitrospira tepida]CAI4032611.1 Methionine--tRNA ligase [Nitrospira tepida]